MEKNNCPKCGKELPMDAPRGICPACLMQAGLASATVSSASLTSSPEIEPERTRTINPVAGMKVRYFGDYELIEEIARGGMGVVWKARQSSLNRVVALKMILSGEMASEREMERFRREAEAAANLQHPNIVAIHEIGERDGQHYFTMDYVDGRNLNAVAGGKPLSAQRAAQYMKTIAEAIHYAHQRGTLHRDLKPQNVLIDNQDQPRITDFGLAKVMGQNSGLTESGTVMGSPSYMPPEQATGRLDVIGPHSDVYSLGAILFELLTGRPPFQAATAMATLRQVVEDNPPSPRKINPNVPVELETICLKCLEKSPQMRYPSARELAEDIARFLKEEPIRGRPASTSRKVQHWFKRHPMFLAGMAAFLVLALLALTYGLWQQNQYLVWHAAHPGVPRAEGPLTAQFKGLEAASLFMMFGILFLFFTLTKQLRGVSMNQMFETHWSTWRSRKPLNPHVLAAYETVCVACLLFGFYFLSKLIEVYVWEGHVQQASWGTVYVLTYFSGASLLQIRRERHAMVYGREAGAADITQVSKELSERVIELLKEGMPGPALDLYQETAGCNKMDARTAVESIARQNGMPGIPAAKISSAKLARNFALTLVLLVAVLSLFNSNWWPPLALQFAGGWAITVASTLGLFLKGFIKRMMLMVPAMAVFGFTNHVQHTYYPEYGAYWIFFLGLLAGATLLMASQETERSRKTVARKN